MDRVAFFFTQREERSGRIAHLLEELDAWLRTALSSPLMRRGAHAEDEARGEAADGGGNEAAAADAAAGRSRATGGGGLGRAARRGRGPARLG